MKNYLIILMSGYRTLISANDEFDAIDKAQVNSHSVDRIEVLSDEEAEEYLELSLSAWETENC